MFRSSHRCLRAAVFRLHRFAGTGQFLTVEIRTFDNADRRAAAEDRGHLLAEHADNEDVLLLSARIERAKGEADKAIEAYGKVIDANPFCADAYKERGAVKYEKGDMKGAQEDAQRAMELQPEGMENVSGDYSAEGIEQKTRQAYSNLNPFGV